MLLIPILRLTSFQPLTPLLASSLHPASLCLHTLWAQSSSQIKWPSLTRHHCPRSTPLSLSLPASFPPFPSFRTSHRPPTDLPPTSTTLSPLRPLATGIRAGPRSTRATIVPPPLRSFSVKLSPSQETLLMQHGGDSDEHGMAGQGGEVGASGAMRWRQGVLLILRRR